MFAYRITDKNEIYTILNEKSLEHVGNYYTIDKLLNTHEYSLDIKYIHFFVEYGDVFYYDSKDRCYICTYDIPNDILENSKGIGYYLDREHFKYIQEVPEYAVNINLINFDCLVKVERIIDTIQYEEYLDNEYMDRIEEIYNIINQNHKVLKKSFLKQ